MSIGILLFGWALVSCFATPVIGMVIASAADRQLAVAGYPAKVYASAQPFQRPQARRVHRTAPGKYSGMASA